MIQIQTDSLGQPYIQWAQADGPAGHKRAWIQRKSDDKRLGRNWQILKCRSN